MIGARKKVCALAAAAVLIPWGSTEVLAAVRSHSVEAENRIFTGDVSITLEEYQLDEEGREVPYEDGKQVVPGQTVDKIVKIRNEAEPVWIRAEGRYLAEDGPEGSFGEMAGGMGDRWIRCGNYFYWSEPVASGESVCFFRTVTVPAEWDEEREGTDFALEVTAQAVQAAHFTPDFSLEDPWFGIPIEACVHGGGEEEPDTGDGEYSVIFENGSEGFVKIGEDFFGSFGALVPGDSVMDSVKVGSRYDGRVDIWFRTEPAGRTEQEERLLEQLQLAVWSGEELIYEGPLSGGVPEEGILLAEGLSRGENKDLSYRVSMPGELGNAWAVRESGVKWIFRAEYVTSFGGGGSGGGGGKPPSPGPESRPGPVREAVERFVEQALPRLGDAGSSARWLMTGGIGMILLAYAVSRKPEKEGEREWEERKKGCSGD